VKAGTQKKAAISLRRHHTTVKEQLAAMTTQLDGHSVLLETLARDVRSLLESRALTRGAFRAVVVIASVVSGAVTLAIAVLRAWGG
jgi:hypothetical protein